LFRAPTREELDQKVGSMQQKLAELKRAQQEIERERTALEETRRRQVEFTTGRQEVVDQITRGVTLLEEAEFAARRDAEQMSKALATLRESLSKVQAVKEESWTRDNLNVELTRSNTLVENARMEWNSARLKFQFLPADPAAAASPSTSVLASPAPGPFAGKNFWQLCGLGLAFTWPVALVGLLILLLWIARS
jgi:hypothetical protein